MVLLNDTLRDLNWNKSKDADLAKRKGLSTFTEPSCFFLFDESHLFEGQDGGP